MLSLQTKSALIWDFDGTLVDSEPIHYETFRRAFLDADHKLVEKTYYQRFSHTGQGVAGEIHAHSLTCDSKIIVDKYYIHYDAFLKAGQIRPFPDALEIMSIAKNRGLRNIIASNSTEETIRAVLSYWNIEKSIDFIIGRNPQRRKKPEPDLFNDACSIAGYPKNKVIVLEDSEIGLQAAYAAGCEAIWIRTECNFHLSTAAPHIAALTHLEFADLIRR